MTAIGHEHQRWPKETVMTITYQVRFHDETGTRTATSRIEKLRSGGPAGNRPGIGYVIVPRYQNPCMLRSRMR